MHSGGVDRADGTAGSRNAVARALVDAWDVPIVVLDGLARVVFVNASWERADGFDSQGVTAGADYLAVCDLAATVEPALAGIADGIRGVLVGTTSEFRQTYAWSGSADAGWLELTVRPLTVAGGSGVAVMREDVTDRRDRGDDGVARSLPGDAVDGAVMATDLNGVITSWSTGAERLYGWLAPDAVGQLSDDLVGVTRTGESSQFAPQVVDRDAWETDVAAVCRDGSSVRVHVRATVLRDAVRLPSGMVVTAVDLTERLTMDDQLRAVTDSISDGLCTLDGSGRVLYVNPQGRRMMRASPSESLDGSFRHWIHGLGDARPWELAAAGTGSRPVECRLVRRDGASHREGAAGLGLGRGLPRYQCDAIT